MRIDVNGLLTKHENHYPTQRIQWINGCIHLLSFVTLKAKSVAYPVRIDLTDNGLLGEHGNYCSTQESKR